MRGIRAVAERFMGCGAVRDVQAYGNGHIHDTFLVTPAEVSERPFILQRVNTRVFRHPEQVMGNMRTVTEHVRGRLEHVHLGPKRRSEVPYVLLTREARDHWVDEGGAFWRGLRFIEGSRSVDTITDLSHAREVGYALGLFQSLISDLPAQSLADTLEGFHITPRYLEHFDRVLTVHGASPSPEMRYALRFVDERRAWASILEEAKAQGRLPLRPTHGDPKVSNVLLDTSTHQAISLVDLDTIKPGLIHYDIGDCLRSGCNPLGEAPADLEQVRFETDLCRAILQGYLPLARAFLTENDYAYLFEAIRLIAFELGLRFLTDYLEGNVYFKAKTPEHNLARALVQFKLTESIEAQERTIRAIIADLR